MTLCTRGVPLEARRRPGGRRESMYITITLTNPFFSFFFFFFLGLSYMELLILCFFCFFFLVSNLCDILTQYPKFQLKKIYGKKIQLLFCHRDITKECLMCNVT